MGATVLRNRYRVHQRLGAGGVGSVYRLEELYSAAARDSGGSGGAQLALKALFTDHDSQLLLSSLLARLLPPTTTPSTPWVVCSITCCCIKPLLVRKR